MFSLPPSGPHAPARPLSIKSARGSSFTLQEDSASKVEQEEEEEEHDGEVRDPESVPTPTAEHAYPDGGVRAYLCVVGGFLVLFSTFGLTNSFAVFQAEFKRNQLADYDPSAISWIGSVHLGILFALGLPSGRLFDDGYFRYQLAVGSVLWVVGVFTMSVSKTYVQLFLSYSVCLGLALGLVFAPTLSCVGSYFFRKRSMMNGCVASGAAFGAVIFPIMLNNLFETVGFAAAVQAAGYMMTGCLVLANILMRPRVLPKKTRVPVFALIASFLRQPSTWFACVGSALVMLGMFIPLFYIQVFTQVSGAGAILTTYSISIINATATIARLVAGVLGDRYGYINVSIPLVATTGILIFAMLGVHNGGGIIAFDLLYGFASGGWVTLMAPVLMSLATDVSELGIRVGLGFMFVAVTCLVGSPIAGALLTAAGDYWAPCTFGGVTVLMGGGCLVLVRRTQVKRKGTWKV